MSFLGLGGKSAGPSSAEKISAVETELEMVSDMFNRLVSSCSRKCIPNDYREAELNKGESVCLDRCVSKFFDVNMRVSEKMQQDSQSRQAAGGAAAGGMGGGMFGG